MRWSRSMDGRMITDIPYPPKGLAGFIFPLSEVTPDMKDIANRENNAPKEDFFAKLPARLAALHALADKPGAFTQARRAILQNYFRRVDDGEKEDMHALQRQIDMEAAVTLSPDRMVRQLLGRIDDQIAAFEAIAKRQLD